MTSPQSFEGSCHCTAIGFIYRTALAPSEWPMRACQCSFCRAHAALSTSDPHGSLEFFERETEAVHRYRFGLRTADFLLCRKCGVYIGAVMQSDGKRFGIINTRAIPSLSTSLPEAVATSYDGEKTEGRTARRAERWTPLAE